MSRTSLTRVNQKLAQAQALIEGIDEAALAPIYLSSLKEAAAFHLICAYQHYLREIAETYWLKNSVKILTEADLIAAFHSAKKHPAEVEELLELRKCVNTWLAQLHAYYESLWLVPTITKSEVQDVNLIKLANLDVSFNVAQVDLAVIALWYESFNGLVLRQRETSAEF